MAPPPPLLEDRWKRTRLLRCARNVFCHLASRYPNDPHIFGCSSLLCAWIRVQDDQCFVIAARGRKARENHVRMYYFHLRHKSEDLELAKVRCKSTGIMNAKALRAIAHGRKTATGHMNLSRSIQCALNRPPVVLFLLCYPMHHQSCRDNVSRPKHPLVTDHFLCYRIQPTRLALVLRSDFYQIPGLLAHCMAALKVRK